MEMESISKTMPTPAQQSNAEPLQKLNHTVKIKIQDEAEAETENGNSASQVQQSVSDPVIRNGEQGNNENGDSEQQQEQHTPSNEYIKKTMDEMNKKMINKGAIFGIHEGTNRIMIKIIDKETKKVLKEYPPEKTLELVAKAWELAGILVDEKR